MPNLAQYSKDFMLFAEHIHVPLGASSGRLGDHWADYQKQDFTLMGEALQAVSKGDIAACRRFWIERTKGGSKDSDCAVAMLWLLVFASRSIRIQIGAYDKEQASEIRLIIKAILAIDAPLNRELSQAVVVQNSRIIAHQNTPGLAESVVEILTTDAFGSHGSRPDVVIVNELSHVGSEAFASTLLDNADKVPHSVVIIATNAGECGTWQERWRGISQKSERWHFSVLDKPAPWVSEADLQESEQRNSPSRFDRLWRGIWSSGDGDTLSAHDIEQCTTLPEEFPLMPLDYSERVVVGGIDLGVKHDHSAIVVLSANLYTRKVELLHVENWRPRDFESKQVDLEIVQEAIKAATKRFQVRAWGYDPWQCLMLAQNLAKRGIRMHEVPFTSQTKDIMARSLLEGFRNREIALYPHDGLRKDLLRLRIKEGAFGQYRLDAVKDDQGHADQATAFAIALPSALHTARTCVMTDGGGGEQLTT